MRTPSVISIYTFLSSSVDNILVIMLYSSINYINLICVLGVVRCYRGLRCRCPRSPAPRDSSGCCPQPSGSHRTSCGYKNYHHQEQPGRQPRIPSGSRRPYTRGRFRSRSQIRCHPSGSRTNCSRPSGSCRCPRRSQDRPISGCPQQLSCPPLSHQGSPCSCYPLI